MRLRARSDNNRHCHSVIMIVLVLLDEELVDAPSTHAEKQGAPERRPGDELDCCPAKDDSHESHTSPEGSEERTGQVKHANIAVPDAGIVFG